MPPAHLWVSFLPNTHTCTLGAFVGRLWALEHRSAPLQRLKLQQEAADALNRC